MSDQSRWIVEGWETFQTEVLKRGWPEDDKLKLLLEVAFYGGANWLIHILEDEGTTLDVLGRLSIELTVHHEHVMRLMEELQKQNDESEH
jgi:hypothetical protein